MAYAARGRTDDEQIIVRGLKNATTDDLEIVAWANHLVMAAHELEALLHGNSARHSMGDGAMPIGNL